MAGKLSQADADAAFRRGTYPFIVRRDGGAHCNPRMCRAHLCCCEVSEA